MSTLSKGSAVRIAADWSARTSAKRNGARSPVAGPSESVSHDFAARLTALSTWRADIYARGFRHGVIAAVAVVAFVCFYLYVGGSAS
jgi:hypothetical protein